MRVVGPVRVVSKGPFIIVYDILSSTRCRHACAPLRLVRSQLLAQQKCPFDRPESSSRMVTNACMAAMSVFAFGISTKDSSFLINS